MVYISGLTPDEFHRYHLSKEHLKKKIDDYSFPQNANPISSLVIAILRSQLKNNSMAIIQSYAMEIDVCHNEHFYKLIKKQLKKEGFFLIDFYFWKETPAITLYSIYKGSYLGFLTLKTKLLFRKELTDFHGRGEISNGKRPTVLKKSMFRQFFRRFSRRLAR